MPRHTRRHLSQGSRDTLLRAAGEFRRVCVATITEAPINGPEAKSVDAAMNAVDGIAETLTGRRDHFHLKGHGQGIG